MKLFHIFTIIGVAAGVLFFSVVSVHAAPLSFSADAPVRLSSPATTLTIVSGSLASYLTTGTSSITMSLAVDTGGTFSITSPDYDLSIEQQQGSGGNYTKSCTSGVASTTISQSAGASVYVISLTSAQCTSGSAANVGAGGAVSVALTGGGGGGGGGGGYIPTPTPTIPTTAPTTPTTPITPAPTVARPSIAAVAPVVSAAPAMAPPTVPLTRSVTSGSRGNDVSALQRFLAQDKMIYPESMVTGYFGALTTKAVQKFQEKHGIAKRGDAGYGVVGPKTRAKIVELSTKPAVTAAPPVSAGISAAPKAAAPANAAAIQAQIRALQTKLQELLSKLKR